MSINSYPTKICPSPIFRNKTIAFDDEKLIAYEHTRIHTIYDVINGFNSVNKTVILIYPQYELILTTFNELNMIIYGSWCTMGSLN